MSSLDELTALEREFWTGGVEHYQQRLAEPCRMIFAQTGIMNRRKVLDVMSAAPRWESVEMRQPQLMPAGSDTVILTYRATARRPDMAVAYQALVSSVYIRVDGQWHLAFHQHTPAQQEATDAA